MAWLKFTSKSPGEAVGPWPHTYRETTSTTHVWSDFRIERLRFARPGAVFLPIALLIAKLAAGEVPHDYGVDLKEGILYQRTVHLDRTLGSGRQVHPCYALTNTMPPREYGPPRAACYAEHEAMMLIFSRDDGDDPKWLADGSEGPCGQGPIARPWLALRFGHAHAMITTLAPGKDQQLPGHRKFPEDEEVSIFAFCDSEAACEPDTHTIGMPASIGAAFHNSTLQKAFERRLGFDKIVYEGERHGRRKLDLGGDEWREVFPAEQFEWGGLLAFNLNAEGQALRPFRRAESGHVRRPPPGQGRLYVHRAVDAWRTIVALPGRRMFRLDRGMVWLRFHVLFAFRVTHGETSERSSIFRGIPLADQERIWAVPHLSSAINHTFNGMKGRLASMPHPLVAAQASPCSSKVGNICVFGDELGGYCQGRRKFRAMPRFDEVIESLTRSLGENMLRAPDPVQHVAPAPLTRTRLIDL